MSNSTMVKATLLVIATVNCGIDKADLEMPLAKQSITWPIQGGLDTKRAPLSMAPGSNAVALDVREERLGEWRRRDGFGQNDADSPLQTNTYSLGLIGDNGLFTDGLGVLETYSPGNTPRWRYSDINGASVRWPSDVRRRPLIEMTTSDGIGFAHHAASGVSLLGLPGYKGGAGTLISFDKNGQVMDVLASAGSAMFRGASAPGNVLAMFSTDGATVRSWTVDTVSGAITAGSSLVLAQVFLDARYYEGSATVTVVAATAAGAATIYEYNVTTRTFAGVALAGVLADVSIALLQDTGLSGVRIVATSGSTPTTRIVRCNAAGAILTNVQVEAVASTVVVGIGMNAGSADDWHVVYQTTAPNLRRNSRVNGVTNASAALQGSTTWGTSATIDSTAWASVAMGSLEFRFLLGLHSQNPADPQDTWVQAHVAGANTAGIDMLTAESVRVPLAAATKPAVTGGAFGGVRQVVGDDGAYDFSMALPVEVVYENNAGVVVRHYSVDLFEQTYLTAADVAASITGPPVAWRNSSLVPSGRLSFYESGTLRALGIAHPPRIPAVTPSTGAGALTLLKQYGYRWVIEQISADGDVWRSPPSVPLLLTMTGTQNTNTVTLSSWALDAGYYYRAALYRTAGNTSLYRRIYSTMFIPGPDIVYVDLLADTAQAAGQALYSTGEIENIITPPASMVALALDRAWIVNREYPTELSYSKQLRPGRLPEFNDEMVHDLDDEYGGLTAIVGVDDKLIAWKESAVYTVSGTGLDDAGAGQGYTVTRIASDMGAIPGSPVLGLGNEAYFVSKRGISRVTGAGAVEFIGSPVDLYLNQPQLATRETVRAIVYSKKWNEVRFVTNASVLVYNRTFEVWWRWVGGLATGSPLSRSLMVGDAQYIFREDGKVFVEGDTSQLTDGATDYYGYLRSAWMVPANSEGRMRLYQARSLAQRTSGGSPILPRLSVFFDYDDATQIDFGPPTPIPGSVTAMAFAGKPHVRRQTCNAFAEQITFPASDNTWRIERWGAVVGIEPGYSRNAQQWKEE